MLPDWFFVVNCAVIIVFSIIAIGLCSITVLITVFHRTCRNFTNLLTCNTCISVTFYFIFRVSTSILSLRRDWEHYQPACIFRAYAALALCAVFCYSYTIHALSRFFCVICNHYRFLSTWCAHWILIVINWTIGILIAIRPFFYHHGFELEVESHSCIVTPKAPAISFYVVVTVFVTPLSLMIAIYTYIIWRIHQSSRRVMIAGSTEHVSGHHGSPSVVNCKREVKLMKRLLVQAGLLASGGFLYLILIIWHEADPQTLPIPLYLLSVSVISIFTACMVIASFLMNKKVKDIAFGYCFKPRNPMAFERPVKDGWAMGKNTTYRH